MTISVLLVAPLNEPVTFSASSPEILHTAEVIAALAESARLHPGLTLTVAAARGSVPGVPMIGVDPNELGVTSGSVEALLLQGLAMAGGWQDYDVVHCLAAAPGAAQFHLAQGGALFYCPAESDPALLAALPRLGRAETADPSDPASIGQALHPVDPVRTPFGPKRRKRVCRAAGSTSADSRYDWTVVASPAAIGRCDAAVVAGPSPASRFDHLCWATRALMGGAAYLHDCDGLNSFGWPEGGVVRVGDTLDAAVDAALADRGAPERFRRWALAHCAPAATAAGLRRRYARICAAR